jgi:hypothetical protein
LGLVVLTGVGSLHAGAPVASESPPPGAASVLDAVIDPVAPGVAKWATVVLVRDKQGVPDFEWYHYRGRPDARDFWPASTIKLYAVLAALEYLHELGFSLDTVLVFEHQAPDGHWVLDTARSVRELLSETFRRSSNEDYTLLLRFVGLDRLNTRFLVPAKGFEGSALMRGYVKPETRPWGYVREEPQRITLRSAEGRTATVTHEWGGRFYAEERGCTVLDARTGNVTTTRDLAECLRRLFFHETLAESERYALSGDQLEFVRHGDGAYAGLETVAPESGPSGWTGAVADVFPRARYFHKAGLISNYALEAAYVDDTAQSGRRFLFVVAVNAGSASQPANGETLVRDMARRIALWVQSQP